MSNSKVILMADNHHGEGNNSEQVNLDLLAFYDFVIEYAKEHEITQLCQLGDYFHQRNKLDVLTINYALDGAKKLSDHFTGILHPKPEMIPGNHDLYYRHSRDTSSVRMLDPYFTIIDEPVVLGDTVMFVPWITSQEEWDQTINMLNKNKARFVFGHYEFSQFRMNQNYIMEHGYSHKELKAADKVFTGHYHARQHMDNVDYIGSPIPFNFNDANDPERGFCVLDLNSGEHYYVNYNGYSVVSMSEDEFLNASFDSDKQMSIRVDVSEDCDPEVLDQVKEKMEQYDFRNSKVAYKPQKYKELVESANVEEVEDVENIDEAVIKHIRNSEPTKGIDNELLAGLYTEAMEVE